MLKNTNLYNKKNINIIIKSVYILKIISILSKNFKIYVFDFILKYNYLNIIISII